MSQQRTNPNRKIYIIAGLLWLAVVAICIGIFVFFGSGLLRYVASSYADSPTVNPTNLYMVSANEGWAVGFSGPFTPTNPLDISDPRCIGTSLHYKATTWVPVPIPGCRYLNSIAMVSADEGWAVGGGWIIHYSKGSWVKVSSIEGITDTSRLELREVSMNSANEGWAAGYSYSTKQENHASILLHYANERWLRENEPPEGSLANLSMLPDGSGWADAYYSPTDTLMRYGRGAWSRVTSPPTSFINRLAAVSSAEVWMAGSKEDYASIWRYKNGVWSEYPIPHTGIDLTVLRLQMISPTAGWAVGTEDFGTKAGKVFTSTQITSFVLRYDGNSWQKVDLPSKDGVQSVYGISADEAWITNFNAIWHYKDGAWDKEYSNPP